MSTHSPKKKRKVVDNYRVNWKESDQEIYDVISQAVTDILETKGRAKQETKARIGGME